MPEEEQEQEQDLSAEPQVKIGRLEEIGPIMNQVPRAVVLFTPCLAALLSYHLLKALMAIL